MRIVRNVAGVLFVAAVLVSYEEPVAAEWFFCGTSICDQYYSPEPSCTGTTLYYGVQMSLVSGTCEDFEAAVYGWLAANDPYGWVDSGGCDPETGGTAHLSYHESDSPSC